MSDEGRRRRRLKSGGTPRSPRGGSGGGNGWLLTVLAAVVVIGAGWFLGMGLARFVNTPKSAQVAQLPSSAPVVTPLPSPTLPPTPQPSPPTPQPSPTQRPTASPKPKPTQTQAPVFTPVPTPLAAEPATAVATAAAATPPPPPPPKPTSENDAAQVVRSYLDAMRRGDPQTAAQYLGNGSPDETFLGSDTRIVNLTSAQNSDGSYNVAVDMQTGGGEYHETFVVAKTPSGERILDKTVKP